MIVAFDDCVQAQANIGTNFINASARLLQGSNYSHVVAGRAHDRFGYALADGSNQNMGLHNVFYQTMLKKAASNYYVIGCP